MDKRYYDHDLLRKADEALKPNVAELCRNLGISRTHYYDILKGVSVSPQMLARLCPLLGVRYADVIRLEPFEAA